MVEVSGCDGGGLTLRPFGELCHVGLEPLRAAFGPAAECVTGAIWIDLGEVTLVSSAAVGFFEDAAAECERRGIQFGVVHATGLNRTVIELLGAATLLEERAQVSVA